MYISFNFDGDTQQHPHVDINVRLGMGRKPSQYIGTSVSQSVCEVPFDDDPSQMFSPNYSKFKI